MAVSIDSPNVDNYTVGKAKILWKPELLSNYIDVGNVPEFELTPELEELEHFSSREGIRTLDRSEIIQKQAALRMIFEEWTPLNMSIMLVGSLVIAGDVASLNILDQAAVRGAVRYIGTNQIGPKWTMDFPNIKFSPSGSLNPITDEWGQMEVTGQVEATNGVFGTATGYFGTLVAPVNSVLPVISGVPVVGETLSVTTGTWTATPTPTFLYQWYSDGVAIPGANQSTFDLTEDQEGETITAVVRGVNNAGEASATAAGYGPVSASS